MTSVVDIDGDGNQDIVASHVSWGGDFVHPYVAWYRGPDFAEEFVIVDSSTVGVNSRVYRFVLFDVDSDGRVDLIGQGYQPFHNGNRWYRNPVDPREPWTEFYDYGSDLDNGHDILLADLNSDGRPSILLMDSQTGRILLKEIPVGSDVNREWPSVTITRGHGLTHYMSLYDLNSDGFEDIVVGREEDGGDGIRWYENPGEKANPGAWQSHFEVKAYFTKVFARDLDLDGDIDFVGSGEISGRWPGVAESMDLGWIERRSGPAFFRRFQFHPIDARNNVYGGHNSELFDVDGDGDEDFLVAGIDVVDRIQRFRWYEFERSEAGILWHEHVIDVTSAPGWRPRHGYYNGEISWGDLDADGDKDLVYGGVGSGFLGWFENLVIE